MASLKGKTLFFTTSPRSPFRMIPEIQLLANEFSGSPWDAKTQTEFMNSLVEQDYYQGSKHQNDPALSARDRITRAPKALGFVDLKPAIRLTDTGKTFLNAHHKEEPFLRQLLKFQLPSPFHTIPANKNLDFWVKPYLEILRLIRRFDSLTFDELQIFGLQLTNYHRFDEIVGKIDDFRNGKNKKADSYREYFASCAFEQISEIFAEEITTGNIKTRESNEKTMKHFVDTKLSGMRDYADACLRYLRSTAIISISQSRHSISIAPEKYQEVDYLLNTLSRDPIHVHDLNAYKEYLYNPELPHLYTDDANNVKQIILSLSPGYPCDNLSLVDLKDLQYDLISRKRDSLISDQALEIKAYKQFDDIIDVFNRITTRNSYYDRPLMFEWNTWRAMTMIDGGAIRANLNFDDEGKPLSTAAGNLADIVCDYDDFLLNVEVTLQAGQKQYDNEGEPIARHIGKLKEKTGLPVCCFFIAPKISPATIAHFFMLHRTPIEHYGGEANILPLELNTFKLMLIASKELPYTPEPERIKALLDKNRELALSSKNETVWFNDVQKAARNWLGSSLQSSPSAPSQA